MTLDVEFPSEVLERFYPNGKAGGLTLDGLPPGALGEYVSVRVKVKRPAAEFQLKGQLAWARHKGWRNLKTSFGVDLLGDPDRLLAFARNQLEGKALRAGARVATDLPVRITHGSVTRKEFLVDLSDGGAFIRSAHPLGTGEEVELRLKAPHALVGFALRGRVAWQRQTGITGYGVEFIDGTEDNARQRLGKLLAKIATR